jgi:predicted nucleic acid-binding Zn ribbon protein
LVCGKAVEPDQMYCSSQCKDEMKRSQKRQRNFMIFMMLLFFGLLFLLLITPARV